ncbi:Maf family protein [Noviherbaspirillum denitrificans]|uniref:dTTP/UTP pyrophosphatase n=1 Tax=Noviherbaspirillum denitrificans TaxID=1968433 RepID=A0A254TFW6_9BURK|nr:Maf family protein [Noviherbaspirillum denitrificans]OWW21541.1 septum formation inhibitor Maf [Noviherbaspirillum denitrificans]
MKPADNKIYLASKSPRRRELLRQIGVEFELMLLRGEGPRGPDVSEDVLPNEKAEDYVVRVTREKAEQAWKIMLARRLPPRPVLAADTTVVIDGRILGKPADEAEAMDMLRALSGRTHQVITSIALHRDGATFQQTQSSDVTLSVLSEETMRAYCATSEPYDKAGGYGIQGIAAVFIKHIAGSYTGIMGLPLHETAQLLNQAGIPTL